MARIFSAFSAIGRILETPLSTLTATVGSPLAGAGWARASSPTYKYLIPVLTPQSRMRRGQRQRAVQEGFAGLHPVPG